MSTSKRSVGKKNGIDWNTRRPFKKVERGICPGCDKQLMVSDKAHYICRRCAWEFKLEVVPPLNFRWTRIK